MEGERGEKGGRTRRNKSGPSPPPTSTMNSVKIHSKIRAKYQGLFGFERGMSTHHAALMAAMRHFERIGDDASLGLVLMALVRGRKPWLMDLRYKYFKMDRLERFSEVLLVLFRWVTRNGAMSVDEVRRLLKKLELHVQDQVRIVFFLLFSARG